MAYLNSTDDDPNNDPAVVMNRLRHRIGDVGERPGPDSDAPAGDPGSVAKTYGLLVGAAVAVAGAVCVEKRLLRHPAARAAEGIVVAALTYEACRHAR